MSNRQRVECSCRFRNARYSLLVELLQTMEEILVVYRFANDRIQLVNPIVVRGMIEGYSTLAGILLEDHFVPMNGVDLRVETGD